MPRPVNRVLLILILGLTPHFVHAYTYSILSFYDDLNFKTNLSFSDFKVENLAFKEAGKGFNVGLLGSKRLNKNYSFGGSFDFSHMNSNTNENTFQFISIKNSLISNIGGSKFFCFFIGPNLFSLIHPANNSGFDLLAGAHFGLIASTAYYSFHFSFGPAANTKSKIQKTNFLNVGLQLTPLGKSSFSLMAELFNLNYDSEMIEGATKITHSKIGFVYTF